MKGCVPKLTDALSVLRTDAGLGDTEERYFRTHRTEDSEPCGWLCFFFRFSRVLFFRLFVVTTKIEN